MWDGNRSMERLKLATKETASKTAAAKTTKQAKKAERQVSFEQGFETMLSGLSPEQMWQIGYEILAKRPVFDREEFIKDFVRSLQQGGINVFTFFVLLGIDVTDVGELTPADFG